MSPLLISLLAGVAIVGAIGYAVYRCVNSTKNIFATAAKIAVKAAAVAAVSATAAVEAPEPVVAEQASVTVEVTETLVLRDKPANRPIPSGDAPMHHKPNQDLQLDSSDGIVISNINVNGVTLMTSVGEADLDDNTEGLAGTAFDKDAPVSNLKVANGANPDKL